MATTYTFDVFGSLDGFGTYGEGGDWGGYWGKQGPEFLERRRAQYAEPHRMVFGATGFKTFEEMVGLGDREVESIDPWIVAMREMPATVISTSLEGPFEWPDATVESGDAVEVVARLKEESPVPLRSHGSMTLNRALMAAGLVDGIQLTIFPVLTGQSGTDPIFAGAADFDLELLESTTLDGRTQELVYRPTLHG